MALNPTQMVNYIFNSLDEAQQKKGCFGMVDCRAILGSANLLLKYIEIGNSDDNILNSESHSKAEESRLVLIESCNVVQHKGGFSIIESNKLLSYLESLEKELLKIKTSTATLQSKVQEKILPKIEITGVAENLEQKISNISLSSAEKK